MTIKKMNTVKNAASPAPAEGAAPGGATIADRFKLDQLDSEAEKRRRVGKKAANVALSFGLLALAVAGVLTSVLYQHWNFLKDA
jgi:hypothetical protein